MIDRILGGLIGAGAADAMGAATEGRTTRQILDYFGHRVTDFEKVPADTFGAGNEPGQVTDDFSSAWFIADHILKNQGQVTAQAVKEALIDWSEHEVFFDRFAGPTTRLAIRRFKGEKIEETGSVNLVSRQATNGAAMKIAPVGLLSGGNLQRAIEDAITVTMVTHDNYLALSGACAVAAAVSKALLPDADLYNVIQAGLFGAEQGELRGKKIARDVAGPSVCRRMEMAIAIGLGPGTEEEKMTEISERIGTGLHISEAVPAAFGFFAASGGSAMGTIISAVNAGYDTDTVGTIAGAIAGTLQGQKAFPAHFLPVLEKANGLKIELLAQRIDQQIKERGERDVY